MFSYREAPLANPSLELIGEMADLFQVSFDYLVGYETTSNEKEKLKKEMKEYLDLADYSQAIYLANKALTIYPNDFDVVYKAADVLVSCGIEKNNSDNIKQAIELYLKSINLLSQNTDPNISEVSIQYEIARCYLCLSQDEKGIDILKKYNYAGLFSGLLANALAQKNDKETPHYINDGLITTIVNIVRVMMAIVIYSYQNKEYSKAIDASKWLINFLSDLKKDDDKVSCFDKLIACCYGECASYSYLNGDTSSIDLYLRKAYSYACKFDSNPVNNLTNLKFIEEKYQNERVYDGLDASAIKAVKQIINKDDMDERLTKLFEEIIVEGEKNEER